MALWAACAVGCVVGAPGSEVSGRGEAPDTGAWAVVHGNGLGVNLRAGPSMDHEILAVMPEGARVHVDGAVVDDYEPVTWVDQSGWAYAPYLVAAGEPSGLQAALDAASQAAAALSPGSEISIGAQLLDGDQPAGISGDVQHVSASAAKAIWVAAALQAGVPVNVLEGDAQLVFPQSDNVAAGRVIDRLGAQLGGGATEGASAINTFMWSLGMSRSAFQSWSGFPAGVVRHASNAPHPSAGGIGYWDNYFTASDVLRFLVAVDRDNVLGETQTAAWRRWMTWTPDAGYGGWLGTRLPADVRTTLMHKAGWLPPEWYPTYATLTELGIVQVPDGPRYAITILARQRSGGPAVDWTRQANAVERISCLVYEQVAGVDLGCGAPPPAPTPTDPDDDGAVTVYCTDPGLGCGGNWPCWPAADCPQATSCDWSHGSWGACR